jgi:RNA polymerase sigma factor (sigma-70 family)
MTFEAVGRTGAPPRAAAAAAAGCMAFAAGTSRRAAAEPTDAELAARCLRGDGTAWEALVQRYQRLVYAVAYRGGLDQHAAADVFQTVFARLVEHLPGIGQPDRLQAWIVTTAKRETVLLCRRGRRNLSMTGSEDGAGDDAEWDVADESPIAEDTLAELQQLHRLRAAIERLDERSRLLVELLFRDDEDRLPYEEIARRLGVPVGSIGPTRARCLQKLRRLLEND